MRLTQKISHRQNYCAYEVKGAKYKDIYGFEKYSELEDNVDCELTLAIDKLGQLEDIEDKIKIDLITVFKWLDAEECYHKEVGNCYIVGISKNEIILLPKAFPYGDCKFTEPFEKYGKTWALTKEELL